jgi:hypothetical protein
MSDHKTTDAKTDDKPLVDWQPARRAFAGPTAGALVGSALVGALAMGAVAIGALAIGSLVVGRMRIGRLEIGRLVVKHTEGLD